MDCLLLVRLHHTSARPIADEVTFRHALPFTVRYSVFGFRFSAFGSRPVLLIEHEDINYGRTAARPSLTFDVCYPLFAIPGRFNIIPCHTIT